MLSYIRSKFGVCATPLDSALMDQTFQEVNAYGFQQRRLRQEVGKQACIGDLDKTGFGR